MDVCKVAKARLRNADALNLHYQWRVWRCQCRYFARKPLCWAKAKTQNNKRAKTPHSHYCCQSARTLAHIRQLYLYKSRVYAASAPSFGALLIKTLAPALEMHKKHFFIFAKTTTTARRRVLHNSTKYVSMCSSIVTWLSPFIQKFLIKHNSITACRMVRFGKGELYWSCCFCWCCCWRVRFGRASALKWHISFVWNYVCSSIYKYNNL